MRINTVMGLIATILVIVSTFFPMISGNEIYENLTSLWANDEFGLNVNDTIGKKTIAIIIIILAALMGIFSMLASQRNWFSFGTFIMSVFLMVISTNWSFDILKYNDDGDFGLGIILLMAGSFLGYLSSILGFMKK